jgi:hypothetical protein
MRGKPSTVGSVPRPLFYSSFRLTVGLTGIARIQPLRADPRERILSTPPIARAAGPRPAIS